MPLHSGLNLCLRELCRGSVVSTLWPLAPNSMAVGTEGTTFWEPNPLWPTWAMGGY